LEFKEEPNRHLNCPDGKNPLKKGNNLFKKEFEWKVKPSKGDNIIRGRLNNQFPFPRTLPLVEVRRKEDYL